MEGQGGDPGGRGNTCVHKLAPTHAHVHAYTRIRQESGGRAGWQLEELGVLSGEIPCSLRSGGRGEGAVGEGRELGVGWRSSGDLGG